MQIKGKIKIEEGIKREERRERKEMTLKHSTVTAMKNGVLWDVTPSGSCTN
jgi:hypothetical protein